MECNIWSLENKQQNTERINKLLPKTVDNLLACLECGHACGMERKQNM